VVQVRVRDQHRVQGEEVEGEGVQVLAARLATALEQAAIHQQAQAPLAHAFEQVAGAGDLAGGTEKSQSHGQYRGAIAPPLDGHQAPGGRAG